MINGKALVAGVFLTAAGAVMLVGRGDAAARDAIAAALWLWPLAVIALGIGLVLRRTRLRLVGAVVAALVPGLLIGGTAVAAPAAVLEGACPDRRVMTAAGAGAFTGDASVVLEFACGELDITIIPGRRAPASPFATTP